MKDRRLIVVLGLGVFIAILCMVRMAQNRPQTFESQVVAAQVLRPAAPFEALDSDNHLVRLSSWLGRHRVIVVFFDGERGADQDPSLLRLKELSAELKSMDVKVVGVTTVIPQVNRAAIERAGGFPFPLVSDIDPQSAEGLLRIHRHWGRFDPTREKPLEGIFLVNRSGQVPYVGQVPQPAENVEQVYELLKK